MNTRLLSRLCAIVLAATAHTPLIHAAYFTGLGGLPNATFIESKALGISGDGLVVVGYTDSRSFSGETPREAFRWTQAGGMVGLGDLPGGEFMSYAYGASYDGSVIVGSGRSAFTNEAFRWTQATGMVSFDERSQAIDVSADGSVVVGWKEGLFNYEAFRWTEATGMVGLGTVDGAVQSFAEAISADGEIVIGRTNAEAFRWTEATGMEGLGDLGGPLPTISEAFGISADGSVIVGGARNDDLPAADEAFRWTETGGMKSLGILPGQDFNASSDASADGSLIVGIPYVFISGEAFIWDESNGLRSLKAVLENDFGLDLSGWTLSAATGISDDGNTIVGHGINPDGRTEGWVANTIPIPPALVNLSGTIKTVGGTDICAMVLASGQFMFSCNPVGMFSLTDLPRENNGTVKRQIYADGFFPKIDILTGSSVDAVVMTRSGTCPSYNTPYDLGVFPGSAGSWINITGKVLLQNSQTPICAMVLANGQYMFSCDGTGIYALNIPLDTNGQFKLQVYADGFAPTIQKFDEFNPANDVRMARAVECQ